MRGNKKTHKLNNRERIEIVSRFRNTTATKKDLALEYEITIQSVSALLASRMPPHEYEQLNTEKSYRLSPDVRAEIVNKYINTEATSISLAAEYRVTDATICKFLRNGIPDQEYRELKRKKRQRQLQRVARSEQGRRRRSETLKAMWADPNKRQSFLEHLRNLAKRRAADGDFKYLIRAARGIKGWYNGVKCQGAQWFDSLWELSYMQKIDADADVIKWAKNERDIVIPYHIDNRERSYIPDFVVERFKGKTQLVEVKGPAFPRNVDAKADAAEKFCDQNGWEYIIVREKQLPDQLPLFSVEFVNERIETAFPTCPEKATQPKVLARQLKCAENTIRGWMRNRTDIRMIHRLTPTKKRGSFYWRLADGKDTQH